MNISKDHSHKIRVFYLILIMMVLYFHGYYNEAEPFPVAQAVQVIGSGNGLWCVANTLFFLLSGMLFFNGIESVKGCYPKMKKRVHSLLVPYLIWNVIFILWYVVLQNLPGIGGYINSDMVGSLTKNGLLDALRVLYWEPANFPLWFVRDLMIMVAVSPLLYYLIKYLKWFTPILLVAISPFVNIHVSPFFILGGCIAMHSSLEKVHKITNGVGIFWSSTFIYVTNAIAQVFTDYHHPYLTFVVCLCGIITVSRLYDWIASSQSLTSKLKPLNSLLGYSFFIYLSHEPVFNIIKKIGLKVLGVHEWSLILLYLTNPLIMCAIAIMVAKLLQRFVPNVYSVLVGGR